VGTLLVHAGAKAEEWWVDAAAASSGDGSQSSPFQTVNEAREAIKTGDTIWIADGIYQETVDFWHVPAGSGGRTTVRAAPGAAPIIDGEGASGFVLQAGETPDMTFQGLTVRNGGVGIEFYQADGGEVIGCTTESTGSAVAFYYASKGYVTGSTLEGSVSGKASDGTVIEDNEIYGSDAEGITLHADSKNCRYSRNVVHDNASVNIYLDSISNTIVDSNLVYMTLPTDKTTVGIMLADESYADVTAPVLESITVTNNLVINNESGIRFWDGHFAGESALKDVTIAHNTVINNRTTAIKWDAGPHQNTVVKNNIFAGESDKQLLLLQANSTDGVVLDHNLWFLPGVQAPFLWGGSTTDHAGWATRTGHGEGDVTEDPALAGEWGLPATNLELSATSPARDTGTQVSIDHDYYGATRPAGTGPDMGAFEYDAQAPSPGGTGGSAGTYTAGTGGDGAAGTGGSDFDDSAAGSNAETGGAESVAGTGGVTGSDDDANASGSGDAGRKQTTADASITAPPSDKKESGCGCRAYGNTGKTPLPTLWVFAVLALLTWRQRRWGKQITQPMVSNILQRRTYHEQD